MADFDRLAPAGGTLPVRPREQVSPLAQGAPPPAPGRAEAPQKWQPGATTRSRRAVDAGPAVVLAPPAIAVPNASSSSTEMVRSMVTALDALNKQLLGLRPEQRDIVHAVLAGERPAENLGPLQAAVDAGRTLNTITDAVNKLATPGNPAMSAMQTVGAVAADGRWSLALQAASELGPRPQLGLSGRPRHRAASAGPEPRRGVSHRERPAARVPRVPPDAHEPVGADPRRPGLAGSHDRAALQRRGAVRDRDRRARARRREPRDRRRAARGVLVRDARRPPERGIARFELAQHKPDGPIELTIETWSRPGNVVSKALAPLSRWIQREATDEALAHFCETAAAAQPA